MSPFSLQAIFQDHIKNNAVEFRKQLEEDIYADNKVTGAQNADTAYCLFEESTQLFQKCNMNLQNWSTNDVPSGVLFQKIKEKRKLKWDS